MHSTEYYYNYRVKDEGAREEVRKSQIGDDEKDGRRKFLRKIRIKPNTKNRFINEFEKNIYLGF